MASESYVFRIQTSIKTLSWFSSEEDEIDLNPVYQRKSHVWSTKDKQYLIDSILNEFDVPKVYLADFTYGLSSLSAGSKKYAVIDGKQRLSAIFDFYNNIYPVADGFELYRNPTLKLGGLYYKDIIARMPKLARSFDNYQLVTTSVVTNDESKINELFVRLNASKSLTGAELRNAMIGEVPDLVRKIVERKFFTECLPFSTTRSQDKNLAAKLLLIEHRGAPVDTKKSQLDQLVREAGEAPLEDLTLIDLFGETESADIRGSAERVEHVLALMEQIFHGRDALLRQQSQVVVFYWFIRNLDDAAYDDVRVFLASFQRERDENRAAAKAERPTDPEIDRYELLARSSNDAGSIRQRHLMLVRKWAAFKNRPVDEWWL